jgi:antitoxin MazE
MQVYRGTSETSWLYPPQEIQCNHRGEDQMSTIVKTQIVRIGNSQGIRIPKLLLEQVGLTEQVELEVQPRQLVVRPISAPARQGWEEQFQAMAARGDDRLLDAEAASSSEWDNEEWQW